MIPLPCGEFGGLIRNPLQFQLLAQKRFGDVFRFRVGPLLLHFLYHPDHVRHVLHDHQKNYLRSWHYRLLRRLLGENLVVSDGQSWLRQRRLAQPAFHRQRLDGYTQVMVAATRQMLARWGEGHEKTVNAASEMSRLALAIASRTLFDRDVSGDADKIGTSFAVMSRHLEQRFNHPFTTPPLWVPTPVNRRFKAALNTLNDIVASLIRERRREQRDHGDLLSMLMQVRDEETQQGLNNDQIRSQALAFLVAGHETTAAALTWTWYLPKGPAGIQG